MRLLLDTQAFLLWFQGAKGLPRTAAAAIGSGRNECFVSHLTAVELAIKAVSGKLALAKPVGNLFPEQLASNGFRELPLRFEHVARFGSMPRVRGDPFDRLIAAQALHEALDIVSGDRVFDAYGVQRIW
jgi:PIN domain nuclease of toxin-antitoxin system